MRLLMGESKITLFIFIKNGLTRFSDSPRYFSHSALISLFYLQHLFFFLTVRVSLRMYVTLDLGNSLVSWDGWKLVGVSMISECTQVLPVIFISTRFRIAQLLSYGNCVFSSCNVYHTPPQGPKEGYSQLPVNGFYDELKAESYFFLNNITILR